MSAIQRKLANVDVGTVINIPSTGAKAEVVKGVYKDNKTNERLKRVGQTYKTLRIVSNDQAGKKGGLMVNGRPISRARRVINLDQAKRAFNTYWNRKLREASTPFEKRSVLAARSRDENYGRPAYLVNDTHYRQKGVSKTTGKRRLVGPGPWEYEGVDFGPKRYIRPSEDVIKALIKNAKDRLANDIAAGRKQVGDPALRAKAAAYRAARRARGAAR